MSLLLLARTLFLKAKITDYQEEQWPGRTEYHYMSSVDLLSKGKIIIIIIIIIYLSWSWATC